MIGPFYFLVLRDLKSETVTLTTDLVLFTTDYVIRI